METQTMSLVHRNATAPGSGRMACEELAERPAALGPPRQSKFPPPPLPPGVFSGASRDRPNCPLVP